MKKNPPELSFFDHLEELRIRFVKCFIVFVAGACLFYIFIDQFLSFVVKPVGRLIFTAPADAFIARMQLSLWGGVLLSLPFILYQFWMFVADALTMKEKKYILLFFPFSLFLLLAGVFFAYFVMVPLSLRFLLSFSTEWMQPVITVKSYFSFVGSFILASAVIFQLPLVLMFLTKVGIATPAFLIQKRRHAVVLILIISAVLTPPDVISQLMMALPFIVLYEIGIGVSFLVNRKHK